MPDKRPHPPDAVPRLTPNPPTSERRGQVKKRSPTQTTLDLLSSTLISTLLRFTQPHSFNPAMTTRTADEAQLSDDAKSHRTVRIKTAHKALTTSAESKQENSSNAGPDTAGDAMQVNVTDAHLDALTYVNVPTPHPLDIHGRLSDLALENLNQSQRAMWIAELEPKILAFRAYGGRIEDRNDVLKARDMIKMALNLDKHPVVAIPVPEPSAKKDAHLCALIKGIPKEKAEELIQKKFLSSAELTILFIPFDPKPTMFITTLKGFVFLDETNQETESIVKDIVISTLLDGGDAEPTMETKRLLAKHRDNIPPPLDNSVTQALRYLGASVTVQRFELVRKEDIGTGEEGLPAWNIFMAPATTNRAALNDWILKVRKMTFVTNANGAGSTKRVYTCSTCYSEGHPGGMCDFVKQQGWITPAPTHSPVLENILNSATTSGQPRTNTPGRGRGAHANARGRGASARGRGTPRT